MPISFTAINDDAFTKLTGLQSVALGNSVNSIGANAFSGCASLNNVVVPASVTTIGGAAFSGCTGMTSIKILPSVISVGTNAFSNCPNIVIYCHPGTGAEKHAKVNNIRYSYYDSTRYSRVSRYSGAGRVQTASSISAHAYTPATTSTIILACAENYPDALTASSLAGALQAPILITSSKTLDKSVQAELRRLKPGRVIIVGGTQSVSNSVQNAVSSVGFRTSRIYGKNRYATAVETTKATQNNGGNKTSIFLATGANFPDALAGGAALGLRGVILVLTPPTVLSDGASVILKEYSSPILRVEVYDGKSVVSNNVANLIDEIIS